MFCVSSNGFWNGELIMEEAVRQLKKNSNSAVYNALVIIRKKFIKEASGVSKLRESGGLKLLLYHIQKPDEKVVDIALSILGNCCLEPETRKLVRELDGISFVVRNLESSKNESILNRCCRVIANLSLDETNGDEIHRKNAAQRIIEMLPHAKDPNCLQSALRALRLLSTNPRHREIVIKNGGVECLGKLLVQSNSETPENVLMGILKALSTLSVDSNSWILKSEYVEALVTLINDPKTSVQESSLYILSNLSKEDSFRPLLGNADIVPVLIKKVSDWETSSPSWQWAIDCFCQCTRESVNRAKIRQGGGIEILIRLLKDNADDRLWHRGLASIINFEYDENSFSVLVDLGMVEALTEKFKHLTLVEELAEHKAEPIPSVDLTHRLQNENSNETTNNIMLTNVSDNFDQQASPHSECYSPECSPPYWTQFWPHSPAVQPSHGYSPGRSISPDRPEQLDEFNCYSPVYEWDVSDESDFDVNSPLAVDDQPSVGVEVEEESSRTEATPVGDKADDIAKCSESSGRSPLGDILMIFSRLSLKENPASVFLNDDTNVLEAIVDYIINVKSVQQKSIRIVNRILRNPLCLEKIILLRIPLMIIRKMIKSEHMSWKCVVCSSTSRLGESFFRELSLQAESAFGYGAIQHLLEGSTTLSDKISAAVCATLLIRSFKGRKKIFIESTGLSVLLGDLKEMEASDIDEMMNGLALFTSGLIITTVDTEKLIENNTSSSCRYSPTNFHNQDDSIDLRSSDQDACVNVTREILASKSEVFRAMLCGNFVESSQKVINIQSTSFESLKCLIHYLHLCRTRGCCVLNETFSNAPISVICDVLALADRFLILDIKDDIITDIISNQKKKRYTFEDFAEIYHRSRMSNCPPLESWAISHLLTDVYENSKQRKDAFRTLVEGLMTKEELHKLLTNELLKSENHISWSTFKEELLSKFF